MKFIDPSAHIGGGTVVWHLATICAETRVGADCVIGTSVWIGKNCRIGDRVRIQTGAFIPNGTVIEDDVFIGPLAVLTDDKHPRSGNRDYKAEPPVIRKGASIGAGAVILPGVELGAGSMVAAGAVVTRDVIEDGLAIGMPAVTRVA